MSNNDESKRVYLDYASSTPMDQEVLDLYVKNSRYFANPSSIHDSGYNAKKILEDSRQKIAKIAGCQARDIIFTGSGTEANNLAILGTARANRVFGRHIIMSSIEHASIRNLKPVLEQEGFEVTELPVSSNGLIDIENLKSLIRQDTILISIIYVNNEIGVVQNIRKIGAELRQWRADNKSTNHPIFHTDACQASGLFNINSGDLNLDLMALNSSKVGGPKGAGCLVKRGGIKLEPLIYGGEQEFGYRAGTENVAGISAFALALEKAQEDRASEYERLVIIRKKAIELLSANFKDIKIIDFRSQSPHILAFSLPNEDGESLVIKMSQVGFDISSGSACSVGREPVSHVVQALKTTPEYERGFLRLSFGRMTTTEDILKFVETLAKLC